MPCSSPKKVSQIYHADTSFSPTERQDIDAAAERMREISRGRIDLRVVYDLDFASVQSLVARRAEPLILRKLDWMPSVESVDREFRNHVFAWTTLTPAPRVHLIVDRIPDLEWVTAHEFAHAVGWRGHADAQGHAEDWDAVYFRAYHGQNAWAPADVAACRAACLCD